MNSKKRYKSDSSGVFLNPDPSAIHLSQAVPYTGGSGSDTIVIRSGDGSTDITNADILTDFTDGNDVIGLESLNYGDLDVQQGTGDYASHVIVKYGSEFLLVIQNVSVSNITSPDFTPL